MPIRPSTRGCWGWRRQFGRRAHLACFDAALLAMPVPNADAGMYPVLQQHAERLLQERNAREDERERHGIVAEVRAAVIRNLANDRVRLAGIAAELGLSPRTLQRKLADAGASFQQVLDAARHALAQDYLRQRGLSLADIAFLLGYQEQSAFTHAFREWSGMNPGAWRERALAGPGVTCRKRHRAGLAIIDLLASTHLTGNAVNPHLERLHPYPFEKLRQLFAGVTPNPEYAPISLGIGEPKHPTPAFIQKALTHSMAGLANYPSTHGGEPLRAAIAGWIERRYGVPALDPNTMVLPVNGSREALFAIAQCVIDRRRQPPATRW
jgi:AraC-like DNA-binding protein